MSDIMDSVKDLVRAKHPVLQGTPFCKMYIAKHSNCGGCESEAGCRRVVQVALMTAMIGAKVKDATTLLECTKKYEDMVQKVMSDTGMSTDEMERWYIEEFGGS